MLSGESSLRHQGFGAFSSVSTSARHAQSPQEAHLQRELR